MSGTPANARQQRLRPDQGQSTLEFALSMVFVIGFTLFFLQICLVMALGSYTHYATFMAARAYLSSSESENDQKERAGSVIVQMLKKSEALAGMDRFQSVSKADPNDNDGGVPGLRFDSPLVDGDPDNPDFSWMRGIRYSFRSRIFLIPIGMSSPKGPPGLNDWLLRSESYLGREDSFGECLQEMKKRASGRDPYFDNGC